MWETLEAVIIQYTACTMSDKKGTLKLSYMTRAYYRSCHFYSMREEMDECKTVLTGVRKRSMYKIFLNLSVWNTLIAGPPLHLCIYTVYTKTTSYRGNCQKERH